MTAQVLRAAAFVIALAAVFDPALTTTRTTKPQVALLAPNPADSALADQVADELDDAFTVVRGPAAAAAATVIVGDRLPDRAAEITTPAFAVLPARAAPRVTITRVQAPAHAPLDARVAINAQLRVERARGRTVELTLASGDAVIDRQLHQINSDDAQVAATVIFVPTSAGAAPLRVTASLPDVQPAHAAVVVDVGTHRWALLFFDARPSWLSTFVRRSIERDPRFVVSSRVITSRNLSSDAGRPPGLNDFAAASLFDAIVVGAPETLSTSDVSALDDYLRRRGGSVVLLFDDSAGTASQQLTGAVSWRSATHPRAQFVDDIASDSVRLQVTETLWPTALPPGAIPVALDSARRPVIWQTAAGAGRVMVSGALDAWKFRDPAVSHFDRFWQAHIADAANAAAAAIEIEFERAVLRPGEKSSVVITLRDVALADSLRATATANATAQLELPNGARVLRLWPDGAPGQLRAEFRAPENPGVYRITATTNGSRGTAAFWVAETVHAAQAIEPDAVRALVGSRGGSAVTSGQIDQLEPAIRRVLQPEARAETWHPMRSPWWIVPFTILLAIEWWQRRRKGFA